MQYQSSALRQNRNAYENVLPDIEITEWDSEIVGAPQKRERVNIVEKIDPEARVARRTGIMTIALISIVFVLFAGIVWRYAIISEVGKDNRALETQLEEVGSRIDSLSINIVEKSDLREVQSKAALLGLGFADNSQVKYIELSNENTHAAEAEASKEDDSFFAKLLNGNL